MTHFDWLMLLVWLMLASGIGVWIGVLAAWISDLIVGYPDRLDPELMQTQILGDCGELDGLDTQLHELRDVGYGGDYCMFQDLNQTDTMDCVAN